MLVHDQPLIIDIGITLHYVLVTVSQLLFGGGYILSIINDGQ